MQFSFLTDQQARTLIQQVLETYFSNKSTKLSEPPLKNRVVDLKGLIKTYPFIGSRSTIYKKVSRGDIPHSKNGKRLIFDLNVIDEWLLSNKIKTPSEIEAEAERYLNQRNRKKRV